MQHAHFLAQTLELAQQSLMLSAPNPRVGCVITNASGQLLGQGYTQQAGGAHAEIMALRDALARGHSVQGASVYVSLEPCAHQGRTGPCCEALIAAGIKRLFATNTDPNPKVAGQGFARLRAAGVEVSVLAPTEPLAQASRRLNIGFFSRMLRHRPWLRMKIAASIDGKTALANGQSQWISSEPARIDGHAWRARCGAVLTGIGTVLKDNPRLDVRLANSPRQPALALLDSRLQLPIEARLFVPGRTLYIWAAQPQARRQAELQARGAQVFCRPNEAGQVDLAAMLTDLAQLEVNELHVEAGARLNGALLRANLVDELLLYLAPKMLGDGCNMANFGPLSDLSQALPLVFQSSTMIGPDLQLVAVVQNRLPFIQGAA